MAATEKKRPRELFPEDDADDAEADDNEHDDTRKDGDGAPRRKRSRAKRVDEGDCKELKPRHLRGKRRDEVSARQAANLEAATRRKSGGLEDISPAQLLLDQLTRLLRPKARRWAMYECLQAGSKRLCALATSCPPLDRPISPGRVLLTCGFWLVSPECLPASVAGMERLRLLFHLPATGR